MQVVELGGDAWSTAANEYVVELAKELGIHMKKGQNDANSHEDQSLRRYLSRRRLDPVVEGVAVFTGSRLLDLNTDVLQRHTIADALEAIGELNFLTQLRFNYAKRGSSHTFASVDAFLSDGNLQKFTQATAKDYLEAHHINQDMQRSLLEPLSRVIYDQVIGHIRPFITCCPLV